MEFTVNDIKDSNPIGSIIQFAGANAPVGWLICDGSAISRTVYSILFSVIGTTYGTGDGSTTFNLPNLQNRVPLGTSSTYTLGSTGGESTHILTTTEMPQHSHTELHWQAPTGGQFGFNSSGSGTYRIAWTQGASDAGTYTGYAGGGAAHNNMQPYISLNYIIKVTYSYAVVDGYNNIYVSQNEICPTGYSTSGLSMQNSCTLLAGGYYKLGKLVISNFRISTSAAQTGPKVIITGMPVPENTSYVYIVSAARGNSTAYLQTNGDIWLDADLVVSVDVEFGFTYICK